MNSLTRCILFIGLVVGLPVHAGTGENFEVVVVGATPGGIGAALAASRLGHTVALVEYRNHIGGMSASGLGKSDIHTKGVVGGLFAEFAGRVKEYYSSTYGPDSQQVKDCREGTYYEPSVAEAIFNQMLQEEQGRVVLFLGHRLEEVSRNGNRVVEICVSDKTAGTPMDLRAEIFIDATYEGDLAAYAGAEYRLGRESRREFDEPHAGVIYMDHQTRSLLPGTTGLGDDRLVAYTYRLCLSTDPANQVKVEKPADYDRNRYLGYFEDLRLGRIDTAVKALSIAPIPNNKTDVNMKPWPLGFPFPEENIGYPEASWDEREKIEERIRNITLGLVYFIQNDPEVPEENRKEANRYGLAKDEFVDTGHFPWQLYVREARRIVGVETLHENHLTLAPESWRAPVMRDSITCGEFPIDSFPTRKWEKGHEEALEGYVLMLSRYTQPYQIPYGIMVPEKVDGLLVPVACSTTHIAFSSVRMEPTWMCLGQAAGAAAHLAIEGNSQPREIDVESLQRLLLSQGQVLTYFKDIADLGPAWEACQYLGTLGFFDDYKARPSDVLTEEEWEDWKEKAAYLLEPEELKPFIASIEDGDETRLRGEVLRVLDESSRKP